MIQLRANASGYDERHYLRLRGSGDLGEGETVKICLGESVDCGRSRHCGWSLKRAPNWLREESGRREEVRQSLAWKTTSRRHCRITYLAPDLVDVVNLSSNGTFVDGHLVDRVILTDCRTRAHRIQLGPHGVSLSLEPGSLPISVEEPARPAQAPSV